MAERRMFCKKITESDAFLDMPLSSQALYFHLNMAADDDGFVNNPKKIVRSIGASEDDYKLLIAKRFIVTFESGVIVIKHWKMHNYIQSDRYKPTDYVEEKAMLGIKSNKAYTLDKSKDVYGMDTKCIQDVSVGKVRLGKDRLDKDKEESTEPPKPSKHKYGEFTHVLLLDSEYERLALDYGEDMRAKAITFLDEYIEEKGAKYKSHYMAIRRWVINAVKERESKGKPDYSKNKFNQMIHTNYDFDAIERKLLNE